MAAMFGQPLARFYPEGEHPRDDRSDYGHGGGRQKTEDGRIYVSAICVMEQRELRVSIYHNPFAARSLLPRYFPDSGPRHYSKGDHPDRAGILWPEYVGARE